MNSYRMNTQRGPCFLQLMVAGLLVTVAVADTVTPLKLGYTMRAGQTNAYSLTIAQQGESGRETVAGTLVVSTRKEGDNLVLVFKGQLRPKMTPGSTPPMGFRPGAPVSLFNLVGANYGPYADSREVAIDSMGHVLRLSGDSVLPVPLGSLMTSFLLPVPGEATAGWQTEDQVFVLDEPLLTGPALFFQTSPGPMAYYYPGRGAQAALAARQKRRVNVIESTAETVTLQVESTVESLWLTAGEPRVSGSTKAQVVLDRAEGWPRRVEFESKSSATTEQLSRRNLLTLKWERLEGADREAALNPPAPRSMELSTNDLPKLKADLQSADAMTRQNAARSLTLGGRTFQPDAEWMALAGKLADDRDEVVRQAGQTLLANYGSREDVPRLVRYLKETNDSAVRTAIIKGLGRLQDSRAIQPLTEYLAAGSSDPAAVYRRENAATEALIKIGPPAEAAVLALLKEKHVETRMQACHILKQIGTKKSLSELKELTGNSVKELSEAAAEAARAIQARENTR